MQLKIGEKVAFLKEAGGGIVRKIEGETIYVADETGFDRPFRLNDLGKVHGTDYHVPEDESVLLQLADGSKKNRPDTPKAYTPYKDYWEIDLHYEDLMDVYGERLISREDQTLQKQLAVFRDVYHKARQKKMRKLIVIHGFGRGVLRQELQVFLKGQDGVDFFDAPYTEYGHGAIQVEIKYRY